MFNVWEYGRKKVTNLRASMRTNRPLSRSQSQSTLNDDDVEDKSGDVTPSDETSPLSSATLPRFSSSSTTTTTTATTPTTRPDSPTSSTASSSSRAADPPPARPSTRPSNKRNSSASTSSATDGAADSQSLTPGAAATSPPTLPATRVKSPAPAIPVTAAAAATTTPSVASLPPTTPSSSSSSAASPPPPPPPSQSRSDDEPVQASVLSRVSNKFGPAVKRKELLHLSSPPPPANGAARQPSAPGTPATARHGASTTAENETASTSTAHFESSQRDDGVVGAVGGMAEPSPSASAAAAVAADARIRREASAAAAAASAAAATAAAASATSSTSARATSNAAVFTAASSAVTATVSTASTTASTPKPALPSRMNSMRRRSQQGQGDATDAPNSAGASIAGGSGNDNSNADNSVNNDRNVTDNNNKNAAKVKESSSLSPSKCEKCGKERGNDETTCSNCSEKQQKQQRKKERESKVLSTTPEEPAAPAATAKYGMCTRPGCRTLTHPSWRFCCTCSKNLKPFEILGTLAHMDILGKAANAVVKGGGFPQDPATLQQDSKQEGHRSLEEVQTAEKLIKAVINGNITNVVNLMLKGVSANTMDPDGISALNYACWHDRLDIVRVLSSFDADLNQRDARGVTALHVACNRSNGEELPAYLVKHGADILIRGDNGESILHHAAAGGNTDGITFAIRNGIDVNDVDQDGATPLSYAIVCDNVDTLEYLLSNGANLDTRCHKGQTILHRAVQYRKMSSLKFAVDEGLKILDRDVESRNALAIAHLTNAPPKIFAFLRDALRNELDRCSFCEDLPAHVQFLPCGHQYSCDDCCSRWKKCKCGEVIDKKVDVITDDKGESGAKQEDEVKRIESELSRLQMERERFNEEKTCSVCLDREKAIVFDCGHTTCVECSIKMRLCHTCRKPIAKKIKFY